MSIINFFILFLYQIHLMTEKLIKFIDDKCKGAKPLFLTIRGSQAYGTDTPTSDIDYGGVFILSEADILADKKIVQINDDNNDIIIFELSKLMEMLSVSNPTALELINTPDDCILYKDPIFDIILDQKDKFITKICSKSFTGYAVDCVRKAKGQNKKQNWKKEKVTRKTPLDFCYFLSGDKSILLTTYLDSLNIDQKYCGLSKIAHSRDTYALFYNGNVPGMKGISFENSNEVRLSSIPKEISKSSFIGYISYNKDGYMEHAREYNSYQHWLKNMNDERWVEVKSTGQKIDGKDMLHCRRLLEVSREISEGKGVILKRPNREYLLSIKRGDIDLDTLIEIAEKDIVEIADLFKSSNLPDIVEEGLIYNILYNIRKQFYKNN